MARKISTIRKRLITDDICFKILGDKLPPQDQHDYLCAFYEESAIDAKFVGGVTVNSDYAGEITDDFLQNVIAYAYMRAANSGYVNVLDPENNKHVRFVVTPDRHVWWIAGTCDVCHDLVLVCNDCIFYNPYNPNNTTVVHKQCLHKLGATLIEDINQENN